jgi:hypothetical protein
MADLIPMLAAVAGQAGEEADPNFKQTVLLLHGDGTNGAQNNTFLDGSTNNFTITRNGNTTQGTFSPFSVGAGEFSNFFDGSGDYLTSTGGANTAVGTGDFCVEFFVYYTSYPAQFTTIFSTKTSIVNTAIGYGIGVENNGTIFNYSNAFITQSTSGVFALNTWNHMVFTRSGTTARLFLNGILRATGTNSQNFSNQAFSICAHGNGGEPCAGYVSNVRLVKGSIPTDYQTSSTTVGDTIFTPPTSPLTELSQGATSADVELLTCQSNRFVDNSTNAFAITRNGDVRVTPFSPFAPSAAYDPAVNGGSGYFDGTGDYLLTTSAAALAVGTSAFTLEGWCYFNNVNTNGAGFGTLAAVADALSDRGVSFFMTGSGAWRFRVGRSAVGQLEDFLGTTTLVAGQWYHFKIVRTSTGTNDTRIYLNGVQEAIGTSTISLNMQKFGIATYAPSDPNNTLLNGYVAGVRFTNTAESSAIPTAPSTAVSGTQYLCNFTNAGIFDNTGKNNLETVGNAQIDTTTKKYGTGSMEFDGTGDWLLMADNPDQRLGTGNFTIEFWVYLATGDIGSARGLVAKGTSTTGFLVSLDSSEKVVFTFTTSTITSSGAITTNAWNHIAVVREGTGSNLTKIYINGTNDGTGTVSTDFNQTSVMYVGCNRTAGDPMKGFIDDLRITKGVARYTANYSAPGKAFPDF